MNTKTLIGILLIIALVGGGIYLAVNSSKQNSINNLTEQNSLTKDQGTDDTTKNFPVAKSESNRYVVYSKTAFDAASDKRRVLYFHAPWCPTCRPLDKSLTDNPNQIPEGVVIFKTDYDSETALKTKYAITYQHTFVEVDAQGNAVQTWSGGSVTDVVAKLQ